MAFRDRFFTPRVARAMFSPLGIVLAGAGAAVGIVTGLGIPGAIGLAAAAWGARVAAAVPRAPQGPDIDAYALVDPWRRFVLHAQQARNRFNGAVRATRGGPIRDRLGGIGERIEEGVQDVWRVANRGQELSRARAQLDPVRVAQDLDAAEADLARAGGQPSRHLQGAVESLRAQAAAADRMQRTVVEAEQQLRLLDARLDEAVARAIELSVGTGDEDQLLGLDTDVGDIVGELEALRLALEDTERANAPLDAALSDPMTLPPPRPGDDEEGGRAAPSPSG